jgi:hypothetical protein
MRADTVNTQDAGQIHRLAEIAKITRATWQSRDPESWEGQSAAVYCRISRASDEDQTGVERQERICRDVAARLRLQVVPGAAHVDNNRSAWKRDRKRPGWDALLDSIRSGAVSHVIAYHPDRMMRQPADLEELLRLADELNRRAIATAHGKKWQHYTVRSLLDSHHVAGLRVFRGQEIGPGTWPAIIDAGMFREVAERRSYRAARTAAMWANGQITKPEYLTMRQTIQARIKATQRKTVVRPAVEVLEGMTGPGAEQAWHALEKQGDFEHLNALLRFLFAAVRIKESSTRGRRFDYGRIDIEPNPAD